MWPSEACSYQRPGDPPDTLGFIMAQKVVEHDIVTVYDSTTTSSTMATVAT
jgi:hypothetical protein